jgi:hypothetical protein
MQGLTSGQIASQGFVRSALFVSACIFVVALLLLPFAIHQSGTGGIPWLVLAGAICMSSAIAAEAISCRLSRAGSHLTAMLLSMTVRLLPPLVVCLALAVRGGGGRQHLLFVGYLLAFYFVTLAAETWLAVKRAQGQYVKSQPDLR